MKNLKLASILAVVFWFEIFVVFSILMFVPALFGNDQLQHFILILLTPFLVWSVASPYFRKVKGDKNEGFRFGLVLLVIGTILDLLITIPLFDPTFPEYFYDPFLIMGYLVTLVSASWFGDRKSRTHP